MIKQTGIKTLIICTVAILAINQPVYAQINEFKLTASDAATGDKFGESVSISGEYTVVGATIDDYNGNYSGSAYVFKRTGTSWDQEVKLFPSDGALEDRFGTSVSISGDVAVVGASGDDDNGENSGSAYVFKRTGTSWTQEAKLLSSDGAEFDAFGNSVSISGDYAVVGSLYNDDNGENSGSAYVFKRTGTSWTQEAKLLPSDGAEFDDFGNSVSISGGYAVVGAWQDDDNGTSSGSAYLFKRIGTSWTQEAKLLPSDGAAVDRFGNSVSISGDYAVVGSSYNDDNGDASGSAYVFKRAGTNWTQEAKILPSDGESGDWFGTSVSISGDYAVVGSSSDDDNGDASGSAYVFKRTGTIWAQEAKTLPSDGESGDWFGWSVSISGDYAVVGALNNDDNGTDSGSAYVFSSFIPLSDFPPNIAEITDVPDDQGAWVYLRWELSPFDSLGQITQYGIWEINPEDEWISLGNVPAIQEEKYIYLAHTFGDSTNEGIFWSAFMVTAHTTDPEVFYTSAVDSGYSIDNLAPAVPTGLLASVTEVNTVKLSWDEPVDEDFQYFKIYRSLEPDFEPTGLEPFTETIDTTFIDSDTEIGETYYYILSAVDFNGNESEYSETVSAEVLSLDEFAGIPDVFALHQNYPNPFNPVTTLRYDLPEQSFVRITIYDILGREVKRLVNGIVVSGFHAVVWDGTNNAGESVGAGVYLYRISSDKFTKTNKMILLR